MSRVMNIQFRSVRPAAPEKGYPKQYLWSMWLVALLIAAPAMADPARDGLAHERKLTEQVFALPGQEVGDEVLQGAKAKGLGPHMLPVMESVGVTLWDEPDIGRRTGPPKSNGNSLTMVRYTGHAE